jgi:hypothetical protein
MSYTCKICSGEIFDGYVLFIPPSKYIAHPTCYDRVGRLFEPLNKALEGHDSFYYTGGAYSIAANAAVSAVFKEINSSREKHISFWSFLCGKELLRADDSEPLKNKEKVKELGSVIAGIGVLTLCDVMESYKKDISDDEIDETAFCMKTV